MGQLRFNNNGIAINHKEKSSQDIIPIPFGIRCNEKNSICEENLLYLNYHLYCLNQ